MENSSKFPIQVQSVLTVAGWFPGRRVESSLAQWIEQLVHQGRFRIFPIAQKVLLEFGGLRIERVGVVSKYIDVLVDLNPLLAQYEEDRFSEHSMYLGENIFPLGEAFNGNVFLAISESGKIFSIMEDAWLMGESFVEALDQIVKPDVSNRMKLGHKA